MRLFKLAEKFAAKLLNRIPGGLADNIQLSEFDPESTEEGIKVEMEHTSDRNIALEIAKDHLFEDPQYYVKLRAVGI